MLLIRPATKRQHREVRNLAAGSTWAADAAVAAALDRVLDPLENLRQEKFQSETVRATQTEATARFTRLRRPRNRELPSWLRHLIARLRYSNRAPYQQIRQVVLLCFVTIGVIAISWLFAES